MDTHLKIATYLAELLEDKYKFGKFKVGLDPLLGLIPGLGDAIPALLGFYIVWVAMRLDLPSEKISQMIANIITDFFLGSIPIVGDLTDFVFKSNKRNLEIIKHHLHKEPIEGRVIASAH